MKPWLATIVVESRLLVREALKALMAKHSYRVVCDVGSTAGISAAAMSDEPKLVILGAQSADKAVAEAVAIRKLWPDSKIILLFESASPVDLQKFLTSQIDGCVPLFVSPDTLISALDLIMTRDVRVMVVGDTQHPSIPGAQREGSHQPEIKMNGSKSNGGEPKAISIPVAAMQDTQPPVNGASTSGLDVSNSDTQHAPPLPNLAKLSAREVQILDGLVKGHANKVIARTCDITEATVKTHVKAILRKIRVANRTQAALWALENGYAADGFNRRLLEPASAQTAASNHRCGDRSVATNRGPLTEYT